MHPRSDAGRYSRLRGAGRERKRAALVPLPSRPGVLSAADGRRDQPRQPAHPIGLAAGDAGGGGGRGVAAVAAQTSTPTPPSPPRPGETPHPTPGRRSPPPPPAGGPSSTA